MLGAEVTVRSTMPSRKVCRALDVAEEEGHVPRSRPALHTARWYAGCNGRIATQPWERLSGAPESCLLSAYGRSSCVASSTKEGPGAPGPVRAWCAR